MPSARCFRTMMATRTPVVAPAATGTDRNSKNIAMPVTLPAADNIAHLCCLRFIGVLTGARPVNPGLSIALCRPSIPGAQAARGNHARFARPGQALTELAKFVEIEGREPRSFAGGVLDRRVSPARPLLCRSSCRRSRHMRCCRRQCSAPAGGDSRPRPTSRCSRFACVRLRVSLTDCVKNTENRTENVARHARMLRAGKRT
jgi:hypothetical protein